jgi:hypothetical protein
MKCTVVFRKDLNNVGDIASNPLQYFMKDSDYQIVDIENLNVDHYRSDLPVVVGGGGLLANDFFADLLRNVLNPADKNQLLHMWAETWKVCDPTNINLRNEFSLKVRELIKEYLDKLGDKSGARILWGAGHNADTNKKIKSLDYPDWLADFTLIGIRDYGQPYEWVPCASCMHPALRKKYPIKNKVIWFEHKKQLIKSVDFGGDPIPRFVNSGNNIDQTIELLGSSEIIVTNSYHGAYWGMLLGKRVIVDAPWSSKFWTMRHQPRMLEKGEHWRDVVDSVKTNNSALEECISANEQYWNKVKRYIF